MHAPSHRAHLWPLAMRRLSLHLILTVAAGASASGGEAPSSESAMPPAAILLVAFGTSHPDARAALDAFALHAKARFPGREIRWAWTSKIIRRKLAERGEVIDDTAGALAKLREAGVRRLAVQPLHVIAGVEYDEVRRAAEGAGRDFERLALGKPLLAAVADLDRVAAALAALPGKDRQPDDALVIMGHGSTEHPGDLAYVALDAVLRRRDARARLATVEDTLPFAAVLAEVQESKARRAWLLPLMSVAGDHAKNDLAGPEPESWASRLKAAGIEPVPLLRGLAAEPAVAAVWLDHLAAALAEVEGEAKEGRHAQ